MNQVQLFITCLADTFFPGTGEAMVSILQRLGVEVNFPQAQTCCGQPAFNAGRWDEARQMARHMIEVFEAAPGAVVAPSGSCVHMIRRDYLHLFEEDPHWLPRAQALSARTFELSEYLVDVLNVTDVGASWQGLLTYHPSCHLSRGLGIRSQPLALLQNVRGATLVELPHAEECCGFGGVFSVEMPEISTEMLHRKIDNLQATQAPTLVVADTGCRLHISGGLHRQRKAQRVVHLAEVLNHFDERK
jgi:L-lactate dehydrogenase complex protein LldE